MRYRSAWSGCAFFPVLEGSSGHLTEKKTAP
jgi:hypothetical protein